MKESKVKTEIPGLDTILEGGLINNYTYLISGSAGSGKTIFSLQWLINTYTNDPENSLFISLAETQEQINQNIHDFGWNIDNIKFIDLSPKEKPEKIEEYHVFEPKEVELNEIWDTIYSNIAKYKPKRLVIDSITFLSYLSTDLYQFRKHLLSFVNYLKRINCTTFFIYEPDEIVKDKSLVLSVDAVIQLNKNMSESKVIDIRTIEIQKYRGSDYLSGVHPFRIENTGIRIHPHIIEPVIDHPIIDKKISSGITELDNLLKGGLEVGTTTLITGPTGVGKSTIGLQFALKTAQNNQKSVIYTFEETPEFIIKRAENLGLTIEKHIKTQLIRIVHINPLELFPDEFLQKIRNDYEQGVELIIIDSIRAYNIAMEQFGNIITHTQNMVNFLRSKNITTLFINEVEYLTGNLRLTDLGVSYIIDNAILLRYAEVDGEIIKLISCLKKRLGEFEPELHELVIKNKQGITVGKKLKGFSKILSGFPSK